MEYILLDIGYHEVFQGRVTRYTDLDGNTIDPPAGYGGAVIDANPPRPAWALPDPVEEPAPQPVPSPRRLSKLSFITRVGDDAFGFLLGAAKESVEIEKFVKLIDWATPDPDGTSIDLDDPRVRKIVELEPLLVANEVVEPGWASEVLDA